MLSDGAGGVLLANAPASSGLSFKIKWIHQKSFSGDMPTCMQVGMSVGNQLPGYLVYPTLAEAEKAEAFDLRQNIRILPNLFDLGLHEYAQLVKDCHVEPNRIIHFLYHYSSERFRPMIAKLMEEASITIAPNKCFSNLTSKVNTGSASIFIMLDEFLKTKSNALKIGNQIFGFVPESGRFSVAYFLLEVVDDKHQPDISNTKSAVKADLNLQPAPISAECETGYVTNMLQSLMGVWHDYRSELFRTEIASAVMRGKLSIADYLAWMECWIPQVREGSLWMRRAVSSMSAEYKELAKLVQLHAGDEQLDWQILYQDYRNTGGTLQAEHLKRNSGGEVLNAYMHAYAARPNPVGLLDGIYIIEGTGQRIRPSLLPRIKESLKVSSYILKFIEYHGENDQAHKARWLSALKLVAQIEPQAMHEIVRVAESVATLYLQQWKYIR